MVGTATDESELNQKEQKRMTKNLETTASQSSVSVPTRSVVINACFGGFSLSPAAEIAYLARKGKQAFFYENEYIDGRNSFESYHRLDDPSQARIFSHTLTEDLGPTATSDELNASEGWFSGRDLKRDDPDLVAVVKELGAEANGRHASLEVVEIPVDVEWVVEEYDGLEHIAEEHRTWS